MSETLTKHWVKKGELMPGPFHDAKIAKEVYLAAAVDALLDDPQALAAYLIERRKGQP